MARTRPQWRAPIHPNRSASASRTPVQSALFKEKRKLQLVRSNVRLCEAITKAGTRCGQLALKGSPRCRFHGGMKAALEAEEERLGVPVFQARPTAGRNAALLALGMGPWPEGLPQRADLMGLHPVAKGRLFEAWANRLTDKAAFDHEMTRKRRIWRKPT